MYYYCTQNLSILNIEKCRIYKVKNPNPARLQYLRRYCSLPGQDISHRCLFLASNAVFTSNQLLTAQIKVEKGSRGGVKMIGADPPKE